MDASRHSNIVSLSQRVPELDGIRGIAILLVVIWHYAGSIIDLNINWIADFVYKATATTWSGVDLFFVLSGFLIGGILMDNRHALHYFKAFYVRRVSRIFPLYFGWLFLFVGLAWFLPAFTSTPPFVALFDAPMPLWTYATFTQNFAMAAIMTTGPHWLGITWSLAVEEQFYLVLPFLIRITSPKRLPLMLLILIISVPALRVIVTFVYSSTFSAYVLMPCRLDALMLGVLCAYGIRQERVREFLICHTRLLYQLFIILLIGVIFLTVSFPHANSMEMVMWGYSLLALFYACFLLIAVTERRGVVTAIVRNTFLQKLGVLAYGVYMFHQAIIALVHGLVLHQAPRIRTELDVLVTLGAFALVILIASMSWSFFERKIVALGHRVKYDVPLRQLNYNR